MDDTDAILAIGATVGLLAFLVSPVLGILVGVTTILLALWEEEPDG